MSARQGVASHSAALDRQPGDAPRARVLVIAAYEGRGAVHLNKLLPALERMGVDLGYAGWDRGRKLPKRYVDGGIPFRMLLRGWGYANSRLAVGIPLWSVRALLHLLVQRVDLVIAVDFESGLPMAIVNRITGAPFVYNVRDNYAMRSWVPRRARPVVERLDAWVMARAATVIVPDESRIPPAATGADFTVIHNCALDVDLPPREDSTFTIYAMGYLRESRGVGLLLEAARRLPDIRVLAAGPCPEPALLEAFAEAPNVDYRGELPVVEALRLCGHADVIFTFYSPEAEINVRAISNKWSDAMMAAKPILLNREVLKSGWVVGEDIGYVCDYDVDDLVRTVEHIRDHPEEAALKGKKGRRLYDAGYNWPAMEAVMTAKIRAILEGQRR